MKVKTATQVLSRSVAAGMNVQITLGVLSEEPVFIYSRVYRKL